MKSMTKLMVIAMLLVAALVVAPAAARAVTTGNTIYVGEEDLDVSAVFGGAASGNLVYFSSLSDRTVVGSPISVPDTTNFDLSATAVGSSTGTWYAFATGANYGDNTVAPLGNVLVQIPSTNLRVLLGTSGTTSVDGQSVTRSSNIRFRIDHNLAGLADPLDPAYNIIEVRLTTPGGGTVTTFGNNSVNLALPLTGQWSETPAIDLTGVTAGTYTARGVWPTAAGLGTEYNTNTVTFEVASGAVGITANKDTVVRGNAFTVTITGESEKNYHLFITNPGNNAPTFRTGQVGVTPVTADNVTVKTTAGGTRSVELNTNQNTREASYTLRVADPLDASKYDEVRVKVEAGSVTVTSSGTGTYYVGEEITLSGTNTDSNDVYLFMTGPNLGTRGVGLVGNLNAVVDNTTPGNFVHVDVEADDTWSYKWDTSAITRSLDSGGYTIYAVSAPRDKENLGDVEYDTQTIQLRPGFITATMSSATVAKGDDVTITGTAQGNPSNVNIWIFGKNFYGGANGQLAVQSVNVESDGTFDHDITGTENLVAGQYFVVVQHPMGTDFEVAQGTGAQDANSIYRADDTGATNVFVARLTSLQAAEAANALIDALESPYVNDAYTKLTFFLEDAWIRIDPVGDKSAGSTFTISGTTNLAAGEQLIVEVTSAAFQPGQTGQTTGFSSDAGTVTVQAGEAANTWSFEVDGTSFRPDQYIVTVESIEAGTTTTGTFNVVEAAPTTQPTGNVTTAPTGTETTPTGTATTAATPTQSPGFGAILALAGLGAVAFLVLRRN
ncbi:MEMAR_RS02690 family S-layer glycoprotein [Methanoculleus sp.]|uniref:MEMAR_RS02690 family S-layer glycoprotein n=1 Tax=Methanoculleus sp. TaxID=90427 RepID=UPI002FC8FD0B